MNIVYKFAFISFMPMKRTCLACILSIVPISGFCLDDGEDVLYAVKATSGSTQDWGTIAPSTGTFTSITQISPTGLGWPLGDIGSEPDPINGYVYTRQTDISSSTTDILAIKKSDGSTQWLGIGANSLVVGYDTKTNKLIYRVSENSSNTLKTYDMSTTETGTIGTFGGSSTSWQVGGIGAVDSYGRTAFQLRPDTTSTLYKIDLDDGTETTVSISQRVITIAWDSKEQKLYGLYDSNSNGAYRVAEINTSDGSLTNVGAADTVAGMTNYVQLIAPNDQRYYVQEDGSTIRAISLTDGTSLGTFGATLRLMPVGAVVVGSGSSNEEVIFDINDPSSTLIKLGSNTVDYTGTSISYGATSVLEGTLKINGTADNSTATVSSGATLAGAGTVGGIINNGNLEPGNSIGTLNVSGTVTLNSDSVLVIEVDASGNSDKIVATGAVTAGGTLRVSPENGTYTDGQQYTIITGSSVSGTFSSITVLSCTGTATPSYGSNSITFTLSGCSVNRPDNVDTIVRYINDLDTSSSADLQSIVSALNSLTGDAYIKAVSSLDSNSFSAVRNANLQQLSAIETMITQRAAAQLNVGSSSLAKISSKDSDLVQDLDGLSLSERKEVIGQKGPWLRTFVTHSSHEDDTDLGVNGSNVDSVGFTLGYDMNVPNGFYGYAVSYLDGKIKANNSEGQNTQTTTILTGYRARTMGNGGTLNLVASLVFNDHSSSRNIAFTGVSRTASAKYKSGGLDLSGSFMFAPREMFGGQSSTEISAGVYSSETASYKETGAASLNLSVDSFTSSIGRVGFKETVFWNQDAAENDVYVPYVSLGLNASGELRASSASQAFSGQSSFTTKSQSKIQSDIEFGLGFYRSLKNNGEFSGGILAKFGQSYTSQTAHIMYRLRF